MHLSKAWGVQVVADNRGGAGGNIGFEQCAKAAADGYTICMMTVAQSIAPSIYAKLGFDALKDYSYVTLLAILPSLLDGAPVDPGEERARTDRAGQSAAGCAHLRVDRQRHQPAHDDGDVQVDGRRQHGARAVQGRRAGDDRPDLGPDRRRFQHRDRSPAVRAAGQGARHRGVDARTLSAAARSADGGPVRASRASTPVRGTAW